MRTKHFGQSNHGAMECAPCIFLYPSVSTTNTWMNTYNYITALHHHEHHHMHAWLLAMEPSIPPQCSCALLARRASQHWSTVYVIAPCPALHSPCRCVSPSGSPEKASKNIMVSHMHRGKTNRWIEVSLRGHDAGDQPEDPSIFFYLNNWVGACYMALHY